MTGQTDAWRPALEVYETEKALVIRAELAGIDEEHLRVALDSDTLTIQGQRFPEARGETRYAGATFLSRDGHPVRAIPRARGAAISGRARRGGSELRTRCADDCPATCGARAHPCEAPGEPVAVGANEDDKLNDDMGKDSE